MVFIFPESVSIILNKGVLLKGLVLGVGVVLVAACPVGNTIGKHHIACCTLLTDNLSLLADPLALPGGALQTLLPLVDLFFFFLNLSIQPAQLSIKACPNT